MTANFFNKLSSAHIRHHNVRDHHIRMGLLDDVQGLQAVARLTDDAEIALGLEQATDAPTHQGVVLHNHYAGRFHLVADSNDPADNPGASPSDSNGAVKGRKVTSS